VRPPVPTRSRSHTPAATQIFFDPNIDSSSEMTEGCVSYPPSPVNAGSPDLTTYPSYVSPCRHLTEWEDESPYPDVWAAVSNTDDRRCQLKPCVHGSVGSFAPSSYLHTQSQSNFPLSIPQCHHWLGSSPISLHVNLGVGFSLT
jgi:hypothetical protein